MKLGIGTYAYAWSIGNLTGHPPPEPMDGMGFLNRCAELGVELVQIADNLPLHRMTGGKQEELKQEAGRLGLAVEVGTRGIEPGLMRTYLEICERFDSPILRTVIDTAESKPSLDEVVEILRRIKGEFEGAGVTLALENHDRFSTGQFLEILERVGSQRVRICLDTVNSFGALEGPAAVVEALGPHTVNLHVKEFVVRRIDHTMGFAIEGAPAGKGRLDVPWLLERLGGLAPGDFNAVLEQWPPPERDIEATVRKEDAWAVESVEYLKRVIGSRQ